MSIVSDFLHVVDRYVAVTGHSEKYLSSQIFNDGKVIPALRSGKTITAKRVEVAMDLLSFRWPEDKAFWPDGVPRPHRHAGYSSICTTDGTWIARDLATGITATGRTLDDALAELRRLLASFVKPAQPHEGAAA